MPTYHPASREIIVIAPTSSQPRHHKRAHQLAAHNRVTVFAFQRGYYESNRFPPEVGYVSLGRMRDRNYAERPLKLLAAVRMIRRYLKSLRHPPVFYAFSYDCLIVARLCGLREGFLEVGDLRGADSNSRLLRLLEKWLMHDLSGLVLTSKPFFDAYYRNRSTIDESRVFVIENKVYSDLQGARPDLAERPMGRNVEPSPCGASRPIRIGLIGLFRDVKPNIYLLRYAAENPCRVTVECHGDGPLADLVARYADEYDNIRHYGQFVNRTDLQRIYAGIDVNFVVYDADLLNVRLALPNKLYESVFFLAPLVACRGTELARIAEKWGVGSAVDISSYDAFARSMHAIDSARIVAQTRRCAARDEHEILDDGGRVVSELLGKHLSHASARTVAREICA